MVRNINLDNTSIIIIKCMALRNGVLVARNNEFSNLEILGDSKIVIGCFNKSSCLPSLISSLMEDV